MPRFFPTKSSPKSKSSLRAQKLVPRRTEITADSLRAELKKLARANLRAKRGYRAQLYFSMGRAAHMLDLIEDDDYLKQQFTANLAKKKYKEKSLQESQITTVIMAVLVGAKNRSGRKKAWKYAVVLDHLRKVGVAASRIAKQLKEGGGVERIYQSIIKKRHRKAAANASMGSNSIGTHQATNSRTEKPKTNNGDVLVGVYMKLADRDSILDLPSGSEIRLYALRIGQPNAELQIRRIRVS
jgi:hypothetical protein